MVEYVPTGAPIVGLVVGVFIRHSGDDLLRRRWRGPLTLTSPWTPSSLAFAPSADTVPVERTRFPSPCPEGRSRRGNSSRTR